MVSQFCTPLTPCQRVRIYRNRLAAHECELLAEGADVVEVDLNRAARIRAGLRYIATMRHWRKVKHLIGCDFPWAADARLALP